MNIFNFFKSKQNTQKRGNPLVNYTLHSIPTLASVLSGPEDDGIGAIDLIASYFASLSLKVYSAKNNKTIDDHWLAALIKNPNMDDAQFNFFYQIAYDYLNEGNVYIYIYIDRTSGRPTSFFRLPPNEVTVYRNDSRHKIFRHKDREYTAKNIIHIPSRFSFDGTTGKSIFKKHAATFDTFSDLNSQLKKSATNFAVEGDRPVLDISEAFDSVTDEQADAFRDKFIREYSGVENVSKPVVLKKGFKLTSLKGAPLSQREQQFFENRKEQKEIINDIFGVPKGFNGGETSLDLEALHILFLGNAIRPIALTVAQYFNKLLDRFDFGKTYVKFNFNSLLRTSLQSRIDSYSKQLGNGILTPNEIRGMEGLPPTVDDAGDNLFIPANLLPLKKDIVDSFLASSRLKLAELENKGENTGNEEKLLNLGDDKK
ncbi:phage portal protein [Treponema denticola]|uniref:phage portal protein n=1 Tax=Treponema denticola TaxID=158 RepID=UPI0020A30952|nr:phage portal protein [Treponema denticola]UTC82646.1 phage portal protein [Treponema denticola]